MKDRVELLPELPLATTFTRPVLWAGALMVHTVVEVQMSSLAGEPPKSKVSLFDSATPLTVTLIPVSGPLVGLILVIPGRYEKTSLEVAGVSPPAVVTRMST